MKIANILTAVLTILTMVNPARAESLQIDFSGILFINTPATFFGQELQSNDVISGSFFFNEQSTSAPENWLNSVPLDNQPTTNHVTLNIAGQTFEVGSEYMTFSLQNNTTGRWGEAQDMVQYAVTFQGYLISLYMGAPVDTISSASEQPSLLTLSKFSKPAWLVFISLPIHMIYTDADALNATVSLVPEPATPALLGLGLIALVAIIRRQRSEVPALMAHRHHPL